MIKKYGLATLILVMSFTSFAQSYVREGFIVKANGDTVRGLVHDKEWDINPIFVEFQKDKSSAIERFTVVDLKAFSSSRPALYEALHIKYDPDRQSAGKFPSTREPQAWKDSTVFLQTLVRGGSSLLMFTDQFGRAHFFLRDKDNKTEELLDRTYMTGGLNTAHSEKWKQQLINYSTDCPTLKPQISSYKYTDTQLTSLIERINVCRGERITPVSIAKQETRKPQFGIVAMVFLDQTQLTDFFSDYGALNFGDGLSYEMFSKKKPNKISLYTELKFKNVSQDAVDYAFNPGTHNLKKQSLLLTEMLRFSYPVSSKNRIFWNVGISAGYRLKTEVKNKKTGAVYPGNYDSSLEPGIALGFGTGLFNTPHLKSNIELRYELSSQIVDGTNYGGAHCLGVVLGVQF